MMDKETFGLTMLVSGMGGIITTFIIYREVL
jgi:hypothetical protein